MNIKKCFLGCCLLMVYNSFGQDTIFLVNGDKILTKVLEINPNEIKFKKYDNLTGPNYTFLINDVQSIKYENGTIETFENSRNKLQPNSQNTNDNKTNLAEFKNSNKSQNIFKYPVVKSCEEFNNVQITYLESETSGLNRVSKIFSRSSGGTTFTSLNKLQSNVETSLKIQASMLGCGIIYVYDRQVHNGSVNINSNFSSGSTPSITLTGYCYNNPNSIADELIQGSFELNKILYVNQNRTEYSSSKILPSKLFIQGKDIITINKEKLISISFSSVKGAHKYLKKMNSFKVQHADDNNLILSGIYQKNNGSLLYFNIILKRLNNEN
jgi:hypothetical protein